MAEPAANQTIFVRPNTVRRFLERWARQNFLLQLRARGQQRHGARQRALHQHLNHQHAIDFVCPLENSIDARIAISARHRIVLMETVTAENLHRFVHHVTQHLATVNFIDRTFDGVLLEHFHSDRSFVGGSIAIRFG
jgi:hypothetical protein